MKKLLLIALVVSGLAFVPVERSDAQVSVGIGVGPGYYGYTPMAITDRIRTMATTTGIAIITATIVIITIDMGIKLT